MGLQCFYAIMGFSYIPKEALPDFIHTLCRIVNRPEHCTEAWRIMSSLMATHLGHSALYNLCQVSFFFIYLISQPQALFLTHRLAEKAVIE